MVSPAMKIIHTLGTVFFFTAIACFGVQHFVHASFTTAQKTMGYPWIPVPHWLANVVGFILVLVCVAVTTRRYARLAVMLLAILLLVRAIVAFAPSLALNPRSGAIWTPLFELVAMSGASLYIAGSLLGNWPHATGWEKIFLFCKRTGPFLFAVALIIFGAQHFIYAHYVATLVPSWIPGHLFWAYFVGFAFLAAATAILSGRGTGPATVLLGTMFCSWVVLVHAPRVIGALRNGFEWTSGFVALAMSGAAFLFTNMTPERPDRAGQRQQPQ